MANKSAPRKRILIVGDLHLDERNPPKRKDSYMKACLRKLEESLVLAAEHGCDAFVHLGDIFHRREVGGQARNGALRLLQTDTRTGEPWPFRKFVTVGNHDIQSNMQYLEASAIGTLIQAGAIEFVPHCHELGLEFAHFTPDLTERIEAGQFTSSQAVILAVHGSITLAPFWGHYVLFQDMPVSPACRLVTAGHIHMPMEHLRADGVRFINPGHVGRYELDHMNRTHMPQVLVVDYALDGSDLKTEYVPLKSADRPEDVFLIEQAQAVEDAAEDRASFIQQVSQVTISANTEDIPTDLRRKAALKMIEPKVVEMAIEAIETIQQSKTT